MQLLLLLGFLGGFFVFSIVILYIDIGESDAFYVLRLIRLEFIHFVVTLKEHIFGVILIAGLLIVELSLAHTLLFMVLLSSLQLGNFQVLSLLLENRLSLVSHLNLTTVQFLEIIALCISVVSLSGCLWLLQGVLLLGETRVKELLMEVLFVLV